MTQPEPDLGGIARAWRIDATEAVRKAHVDEWGYADSSISTWIVNGPYHPFWSWWHVGVISLKDVPGAPPANKQYPEAEYEFAIYSLQGTPNVQALRDGDLANRGFESFLTPADVTFHFDGVTDEQAREICDAAVRAIIAGQSCDSDFRQWWLNSLAETVEHYKAGIH